jgi:cytochrome c oxidase assembly protein subunit 11
MPRLKRKPSHRSVLLLCAGLLGVATLGVIYSPTLYSLFCAATGYNGTVQRAAAAAPAPEKVAGETFRITFDGNVADGLNWEFRPEQPDVSVEIGEPTTIYYYAKNLSDKPVVAHAVFNVSPFQVAPYFFKIQCFCFTDETLKPGEEAHMPVVFYLDKSIVDDNEALAMRRATLSYTFYRQGDDPDRVAAARDLAAGSEQEAATIASGDSVEFANDAPRR